MRHIFFIALLLAVSMPVMAQEVHGTLRGKYEYQPEDRAGRFEVRTARVSVSGDLTEKVSYKAEVDLCDEGVIKMLDAYTRIKPMEGMQFTIGQMRVPFTIDAHRSPHQQYFANRSFIAKQVGNVRDVGATLGYDIRAGFPIKLEAGLFNGSGLTNQKDFWTKQINFSAKAQFFFPQGVNLTLGMHKIQPSEIRVMMYDIGSYIKYKNWHVEAELLYKTYADQSFQDVYAVDAFINYDIPLRKCFFQKISPLLRFDYMSDHSSGIPDEDLGKLIINDYQRSRLTGGFTLSLSKPFVSDLRLNYEKYFYRKDGIAKVSEKDKFVIEIMTRF